MGVYMPSMQENAGLVYDLEKKSVFYDLDIPAPIIGRTPPLPHSTLGP
jgi:hypothetical protein